ncbi:cysteine desulfurase [Candidatus Acetothermia bacterium]|nr:cysteine desulfurase [Candidatus Acetothermia bacterium]
MPTRIPSAKIYLDHAATTPVDPRAAALMQSLGNEKFANPNSSYRLGQESRRAVEDARRKISKILNCAPGELIFMGGGTEADNLAIKGFAYSNQDRGRHIITSTIEHHAVLRTCQYLERRGFTVTYLPVDSTGLVDAHDVKKALRPDTILVSIMHANNEIGTVQPIAEIGALLAETEVYFHTDAVQTVGHLPVDVQKLNVDLLSFSAHKFYGPKGVGGLYMRRGTVIDPLIHGGGQEHGMRSGTENVAGIAGMGLALEIASEFLEEEATRLSRWRDRLIKEILQRIEGARLTGHPTERLPGTVSFCFENVDGESIILKLDLEGICASTGAACHAGEISPSHVLLALGLEPTLANGSLRLTLGRTNSASDLDCVLEILPKAIQNLRAMSAAH